MGPLGPWATGRTDWSPLAGMTGTRPAVTKYSITRFSPAEWRMSNEDVLRRSHNAFDKSIMLVFMLCLVSYNISIIIVAEWRIKIRRP